jgi:hypothetical protein
MKIKLKKYEQALAILPGCKGMDRSLLYSRLEYSGYKWNSRANKWVLPVVEV